MRSRPTALLVAMLVLSASAAWAAAVPNRIAGAVVDSARVGRPGNVQPQVQHAADMGRVPGSTQLPGLSLNFTPSAAQQAALDALLVAQADPSSPSYHRWLTPSEFGDRFGMSAEDLAKVTAWLQGRGFTVERIAPSRNAIHFSGTASQVEQAFGTELHTLSLNGEPHFANTTDPTLPAAFAATVSSIGGLHDFRPRPHARTSDQLVPYGEAARTGKLTPFTTNGGTPPTQYISPSDFVNIYDVKALYNAGFSGSATYPIAVVGQTAIRTADITDFRNAFGLSTNLPTMVLVPNTGSSAVLSTDDLGESELDVEWSGAVAPNVPIYFIYTGNSSTGGSYNYGVFDALQYAIQGYTVNGKAVPIVSISYGECELSDTTTNFNTYEAWFKQATIQGQTILTASGDLGAAGCDYTTTAANNYAATQGLAVDYPSSSVYVTSVGGSSFSADVGNASAYWAISNDNNYGNELGVYIPSTSWNNTPNSASSASIKGLSASGGGVSSLWAKPSWQTGVPGIPTDGKRDVPDIALSADPRHDGYLVCYNLGCEGTSAAFNVYGGTSVGAPSFAGILALTEQKLAASQGNLNPSLYALAANAATYASAFHDITTGSNIVPCIVSSTDKGCTGGSMGYNAGTGYDLVTGLGDVDALNFANALAGVASRVATTETLTYTPASPLTGQTVTFTATLGGVVSGKVPGGSVNFTIDGAATGSTVAITSTGMATFSTTFTTAGPHTITAVYSGDASYNGSSASVTLSVGLAANAANAATTTTLTASPSAVAVGSALTVTANVTSTVSGTLAGTVTFSTPTGTLGTKAITASSAGNSGSAVLTVSVAVAALPLGTDTITATFNGGGANTGGGSYTSSSGTASVTVTNPTITVAATNISTTSGGSGTSTITLTSGGNYAGTVALTATSTSTLKGSYIFSPASVTLTANGTGTSTFTLSGITGAATPGTGLVGLTSSLALGGGLTFAGLLFFGTAGTRRKRPASLLSALVFTALVTGLGCSSSSTPVSTTPVTGTYTVTITAADTSTSTITGTTTLTVTIK